MKETLEYVGIPTRQASRLKHSFSDAESVSARLDCLYVPRETHAMIVLPASLKDHVALWAWRRMRIKNALFRPAVDAALSPYSSLARVVSNLP